jgi:hypothetical protein
MNNDMSMIFKHGIFSKESTQITATQLSEMHDQIISVLEVSFNSYDNEIQFLLTKIKTPPKNKRQSYQINSSIYSKKNCLKCINDNMLYFGDKINELSELPFYNSLTRKHNNPYFILSLEEYLKMAVIEKTKCF